MAQRKLATGLFDRLSSISSSAAEMAFYFALSFVPFLGLTAAVADTWLPGQLGGPLAAAMVAIFPREAGLDSAALARWVGSVHGSGWLAAGGLLATWSSFRFMAAGVRALAGFVRADLRDWRHRARRTLSAVFLMGLWMSALMVTSFVLLASPGLQETLVEQAGLGSHAPSVGVLAHALAAVVLWLTIALTYRAVPGLPTRGGRLWLVAGLATAGWTAVAWAATGVLPVLWTGKNLYGALGGFVLFLLWCWANAWVLLACALLAGRASRRAKQHPAA
jgi:uncharacterized BrkB/YihY/UPF0761 family membrane protein